MTTSANTTQPILTATHRRTAVLLPLYVGTVTALGAWSLAVPPAWTTDPAIWLPAFLVMTAISVALEFATVPMPAGGSFAMATVSHVAAILLVPPPLAAVSIGLSVLVAEVARRASAMKVTFNVAGMVLTGSIASALAGRFGTAWDAAESLGTAGLLATFVAVAVCYFGVNAILHAGVVGIVEGRSVVSVLRQDAGSTVLGELATAAIGIQLALIWIVEPVLIGVLAIPAVVIARSFDHIRRLNTETRAAVESLAELVDDRDSTTFRHSQRVADRAAQLARALALPDDEVALIRRAASVHDLGKIGVPDRVLLKPGPLTADERQTMSQHTRLGWEVLSRFGLFRPGAAIVRHHHERWDGTGYPDGLAGAAIPYGARIVAVADAFDAMTSDRPYRRALDEGEALRRLAAGAGKQWDPQVVATFLALHSEQGSSIGAVLVRAVES
ncbi:MAG TPA: HD domain-containing phosphohydrolase [Candidatus Limnocylindrales bacterium]|jgi:putative nucleotidyltransferase with HDIG domain